MAVEIVNEIKKYYSSKDSNEYIHTYNAYSMSDVYNILEDIGENVFKNIDDAVGRPLWFRGQSSEEFMLIPSLYRERENKQNSNKFYSTLSLAEEYRHQNFSARVNHLMSSNPKSRVEWQEVLQHHFGKTRFMDWSESLETAVMFALEPFLDTKNTLDNYVNRAEITSGIWILDPYKLNEHVYDFFTSQDNFEYIKKAICNLFSYNERIIVGKKIQRELKNHKEIYFNFSNSKIVDLAINGLVSVCILDEYYHDNAEHMRHMLKYYEFNPFFYLIVRYYADALPVEAGVNKMLMPPLASIQPYHSERIRTQRGTFTIFPNYYRSDEAAQFTGTKMDVIAIESQKNINKCFCNIRLCDPVRIAKELIYAGERWPEIYPDIQVYADYLETKKFFL